MKRPSNWPKNLWIHKESNADNFGTGAMYSVWENGHAGHKIAEVYKSSRGWAYHGEVGRHGQGYGGERTMEDVLWHLAQTYLTRGK